METFCLPEQDIDAALTLIQLAAGEVSCKFCNDGTDRYDTTAPRGKSKRKQPSELDSLSAIETILPFGRREIRKWLQLCDKSVGCDDAKANDNGEERSSGTTANELCSAVETRREEIEREAEGSKSYTSDLWCGGDYLCRRKTKFRSVVDLYRTPPSL